jgi:hypothetical protein
MARGGVNSLHKFSYKDTLNNFINNNNSVMQSCLAYLGLQATYPIPILVYNSLNRQQVFARQQATQSKQEATLATTQRQQQGVIKVIAKMS